MSSFIFFIPKLAKKNTNTIADMGPCFKGRDTYYKRTASCCRVVAVFLLPLSLSLLPLEKEERDRKKKKGGRGVGGYGECTGPTYEDMFNLHESGRTFLVLLVIFFLLLFSAGAQLAWW